MAIIRWEPLLSVPRVSSRWPIWDENLMPQMSVDEGLDVWEEDNKIYVSAAIPGIPAEKVEVTYEDGILHIMGKVEEKEEKKEKKKIVYRQDMAMVFDYTTTLPRPIDPKSIEATVEDGQVTIRGNISQAAKPKKIAVKSGSRKSH